MTQEALKLALDALGEIEWSNNSQWQSDRAKVAITALREALANEQGDDVYVMGNYAGKGKVSSVTLGGVSFTGNGTAGREADVKPTGFFFQMPEQPAQQPQMHPCAGRNCGSTNPNLHSAECFEDYEKATGMVQQEPVANIRTWRKNGELHAELWNWDRGVESLPDGEHDLYIRPQTREPLTYDQRMLIVAALSAEDFADGEEWDDALIDAVEAAHGIKGEA